MTQKLLGYEEGLSLQEFSERQADFVEHVGDQLRRLDKVTTDQFWTVEGSATKLLSKRTKDGKHPNPFLRNVSLNEIISEYREAGSFRKGTM